MKYLVGEWELKNFDIEKPNGLKKPWGNNSQGILIYTLNGYMSVSINSDVNSSQPSNDDKYRSTLFYAGKYEIIDDNKIAHHVMNASDISRIGKDLFREATLDNNELKLISHGDFGIASLIWKKINNKLELTDSKIIYSNNPLTSNLTNHAKQTPIKSNISLTTNAMK